MRGYWKGGGNGELLPNVSRVPVYGDGKVLEIVVMVAQRCECNECH